MSGGRLLGAALSVALAVACEAKIEGDARSFGADGRGILAGGSSGGTTAASGGASDGSGLGLTQVELGPPLLRRLTGPELERSLRDVFSNTAASWTGVALGSEPVSALEFTDHADLVAGDAVVEQVLDAAESLARLLTSTESLPKLLPCQSSTAGEACSATLVDQLGFRLLRRPLRDEERADFSGLFRTVYAQSDFATGIKWMLVAMIQSPFTLYRTELGTALGDRYELTPYEIASELAYDFSGTTPSPELLASAAQGKLGEPEARVEVARALLGSPAGQEVVRKFTVEWLGYERVRGNTRYAYPGFPDIADQMIEETQRFLHDALYERGAGPRDLFTLPHTFLNAKLSQFYGYGAVKGPDFVLTPRPAGFGGGLLAQGSILAGYSRMEGTSPTLRGLRVYKRFLCGAVPPPPANVPPLPAQTANGPVTTRARYETLHAANPACAACHVNFDPSGFALEHFDETGRYREQEGSLPIDDTGKLMLASGAKTVAGLPGLSQELAGSVEARLCLARLLAAYAFGGSETFARRSTSEAESELVEERAGVLSYFASLAGTPHLRYRALVNKSP